MVQDTNPNTKTSGPGARLMQARLDLHLAREDVSAKLHMSSRQIQALEENDYAVLPGSTYVRGYLRNYALLLGLDPAPILAAHAQVNAKDAKAESENIAPRREITSRHHQIRFTTYLVAFIVIGLAVAWWQGRDVRPPNPLLANQQTPQEPAVPEATEPASQQKNPPQTALAPKVDPPTTAGLPAPVAGNAVVPPPTPVAVAVPVVPAGPHGKLVVYADRESWVDIRDGRQAKLAYETLQAGRVVTFDAPIPINIFLGNAAGVRVEYNGKPVDVAKHMAGVTARFSVGGAEPVQPQTPQLPAR
ncbi:MAG: DUF4115 domain-containing protein [Gammaproteobacteria bacterium]|nr:DUF4115 domain-containing protein [Gammaproteobacteria bacterium]